MNIYQTAQGSVVLGNIEISKQEANTALVHRRTDECTIEVRGHVISISYDNMYNEDNEKVTGGSEYISSVLFGDVTAEGDGGEIEE